MARPVQLPMPSSDEESARLPWRALALVWSGLALQVFACVVLGSPWVLPGAAAVLLLVGALRRRPRREVP